MAFSCALHEMHASVFGAKPVVFILLVRPLAAQSRIAADAERQIALAIETSGNDERIELRIEAVRILPAVVPEEIEPLRIALVVLFLHKREIIRVDIRRFVRPKKQRRLMSKF